MTPKPIIPYKNEFIKFEGCLPSKLYIGDIQNNVFHCHREIELIYCLQGCFQLDTERGLFELKTNDIMLLNPNTVHKFIKVRENNIVIILQISLEQYKKYIQDIDKIAFFCNSIDEDRAKYDCLIELLKEYICILDQKEKGYLLKLKIVIDKIVDTLYSKFQYKLLDEKKIKDSNINLIRINKIFDYVHEHYKEPIQLKDIADELHLSTNYLMHFFKEKTGTTVLNYITMIRLEHAYNDLIGTDKTILDIALTNGFSSTKAFIKNFKRNYNMTPSEYRKKIEEKKLVTKQNNIVQQNGTIEIKKVRDIMEKLNNTI